VTRRNELLLAAAGILLVISTVVLLLVRPTRQATSEAHAERDTAISESQSLRDQIKALEALKADEADLRARAAQARAEFPATPALPGLVDALQDAASLSGVELGSVAPSPPKVSAIRPELAEITATVAVSGGYFEIQDFLVRLENLVKGSDPERVPPRSMLVRSVGLNGSSEQATGDSAAAPEASASPDELKGNIELLVFQLAQSTGTAGTTAPAPAPAAQGTQVR
jgi:hypothetical protein